MTFQFNFSDEIFLPLIGVFGLLGLFGAVAKREYLLAAWVIAPLLVEPRSAPQYMVMPLAMLAGIGLIEVVLPGLKKIDPGSPAYVNKVIGAGLIYLFLYALLSAYLVGFNLLHSATLQPPDLQSLAWVMLNTPPASRFLILTGAGPLADPYTEWFPALAQRKSLNTVFGTEWLRQESFPDNMSSYEALQLCLNQDQTCLQSWSDATRQHFSGVVIRGPTANPPLVVSLLSSPQYRLIYQLTRIFVFEKIQ